MLKILNSATTYYKVYKSFVYFTKITYTNYLVGNGTVLNYSC